jgi:hypothetical protein
VHEECSVDEHAPVSLARTHQLKAAKRARVTHNVLTGADPATEAKGVVTKLFVGRGAEVVVGTSGADEALRLEVVRVGVDGRVSVDGPVVADDGRALGDDVAFL